MQYSLDHGMRKLTQGALDRMKSTRIINNIHININNIEVDISYTWNKSVLV